MQQQRNLFLFMMLAMVFLVGGPLIERMIWPPKRIPIPKAPHKLPDPRLAGALPAQFAAAAAVQGGGLGTAFQLASDLAVAGNRTVGWRYLIPPKEPAAVVKKPPVKRPQQPLIQLGDENFFLQATIDPNRGAGIRRVVLTNFQEADSLGRPVWQEVDGKRTPVPMELVPTDQNEDLPSNLIYHYPDPERTKNPSPRLGEEPWELVGGVERGDKLERAIFQIEVDGVTIQKVYTLRHDDYHIGLEVKFRSDRERPFRYQIASAHGLPIEGDWYTYTFRNAFIGREDNHDRLWRSLQDLRQIAWKAGGDEVRAERGTDGTYKRLLYGGVGNQFFASLVVVDEANKEKGFLDWARPTIESSFVRGRVKAVADDRKTYVMATDDGREVTIHPGPDTAVPDKGEFLTVVYRVDRHETYEAIRLYRDEEAHKLLWDDIAVRMVSSKLNLEADTEVTHKYLLYNGPLKVRLLGYLSGAKEVSPALIARYEDKLHLNTLTDYPWPGWFGDYISGPTGLSVLLIATTNLMHSVLYWLHWIVPVYGLNILMLTIFVRLLMFPVSRRQQMISVRMQELAPELKKLQEKYKDDRQALGMAQWDLYRKHGVSPFGTCWLIFLQMPIFLGLYYALQESIQFRLAPFLWMPNLAAPDMLIYWTQSIPWISRPEDYATSYIYLGPFFNLLPIVSVILMFIQQQQMTPPAADPEMELQQKITMRVMLVMMGFMFYKVASGLCLYFIATSVWGFAERQFLPKKKKADQAPAAGNDGLMARMLDRLRGPEPEPDDRKGGSRRRRDRRADAAAPLGFWDRLRRWWDEVRRQAEKK